MKTYTVDWRREAGNTNMIPPAFTEVWQLMFQCVFNHFKHDTDDSAQPPVTQDQRLQTQHSTSLQLLVT